MAEEYWVESRRPLASLVFLAPLLVGYELGVLLLGVQNGADAFLAWLLNRLGFSQHFVLPLLTVCLLLGWHHLSRESWRLSGGVLSAMTAESVLLAVCLRLILLLQGVLSVAFQTPIELSIGSQFKLAVGFLGAGIYEELLFRLILLSLVAWGFRRAGTKPWLAMILAAVLTSLVFSAAHYRFISANGYPFDWFSFMFRFVAGMFFSVVFIYRGFGIAAGSHAAYDILAHVVWVISVSR
jgi:membrane protease YdiL (CAAX protease family)